MVRNVVFLLALWGVMQPAFAEVITIDPDDYPIFPATDISTAFDGVTLSTNAGGAVYAANWTTSPDNNAFAGEFGVSFSFNWQLFGGPGPIFRASFDQPTDFISLLTTTIPGQINNSRMQAFNNLGAVIDFSTTSGGTAPVNLIISRPTADIAYIPAENAGPGTETVLETLQFNRILIPEAAALGFFLFGLAGVGFSPLRSRH